MPDRPEVTAVIVSWNVRDQLSRCLASLRAVQDVTLHVVVVENASHDGSAAMVREQFPGVTLIANTVNRGFAAAVNQGIDRSVGDVVLVNPDLVLQAGTLSELDAALQRHPRGGIAGPRITFPDGALQPSVRRFPTTGDLALTLLKLPNFFPSLAAQYAGLHAESDREQIVDQVMGSCFLIRRSTLDEVGKFDEGFFTWFEEVDYCKRALQQGWETVFVPSAVAIHEKAASFSQLPVLRKQRIFVSSMMRYVRKHLGLLPALLLTVPAGISLALALLQQLFGIRKPRAARQL